MTPTQERLHKEHVERRRAWARAMPRPEPRLVAAPAVPTVADMVEIVKALPEPVPVPPKPRQPIMSIIASCEDLDTRQFFMADILRTVSRYYHFSPLEMRSIRRAARLCRARQVSMWLCFRMTGNSYPAIGRAHGGRDHTTAMHAVRRIDALIKTDEALAAQVEELFAQIVRATA